jgi:hypothetical protein
MLFPKWPGYSDLHTRRVKIQRGGVTRGYLLLMIARTITGFVEKIQVGDIYLQSDIAGIRP